MKSNKILISVAAAGMAFMGTSCIGNLDTLPLNESDAVSETVYGKVKRDYRPAGE